MKHKLCYVENNLAFFSSNPKQTGDDWDDSPANCNAGRPYEDSEGQIIILAYDGGYMGDNWSKSVDDLNNKIGAWIEIGEEKILGGCTIDEFKEIIKRNGGRIYVEELNEHL